MIGLIKTLGFRCSLILVVAIFQAGCSTLETAIQPTDFNGVWFVTEYDEIKRPDEDNPSYTEEALRRLDFYKSHFDVVSESAVIYCNPIGMPWAMLARARDYPREVYQTKDRLIVFFEYMDEYRVIYLNQTEVPKNWLGSKMGYSLGHWEGKELVVETSGYLESSEASSFQRSAEARTIERWRLIDHPKYGKSLEVEMELTDPVIYSEPRYARALWKIGEPGALVGTYGCPATLWEEYVDKRIEETESE